MKPAYAVYLLQIEWNWDHFNTELATVTVEGREGFRYEPEFERLVDPTFPQARKKDMLDQLRAVTKALGRSSPESCRMVRLYRIEDATGILFANGGHEQTDKSFAAGETASLQMALRPVCGFDAEGNPVALSAKPTVQTAT